MNTPANCDTPTEPWLDAALRSGRPASIEDDGFSAAVLARIAASPATRSTATRGATLSALEVLEAMRLSASGERRFGRWTLGGAIVGTCVAIGLMPLTSGPPAFAPPLLAAMPASPVFALFGVSCLLALILLRSPLR
ncbi:MAG: hypothetical protein ABJA61_00600 [Caldimonas sp.]